MASQSSQSFQSLYYHHEFDICTHCNLYQDNFDSCTVYDDKCNNRVYQFRCNHCYKLFTCGEDTNQSRPLLPEIKKLANSYAVEHKKLEDFKRRFHMIV